MNISITLGVILVIGSIAGPLAGYWLGWKLRGRTEAATRLRGAGGES